MMQEILLLCAIYMCVCDVRINLFKFLYIKNNNRGFCKYIYKFQGKVPVYKALLDGQ